MVTSHAISDLAHCLRRIERAGYELTSVEGSATATSQQESEATVNITLPVAAEIDLPDGATLSIEDATVTESGALDVEVSLEITEPLAPPTDSAQPPEPSRDDPPSGEETATTGPASQSTPEATANDSQTDATPAGSGAAPTAGEDSAPTEDCPTTEDPPRYRDPTQLEAVYHPDKTFPEMTAELGVDVTAQTVRKYMIEHGIHDPGGGTAQAEDSTDPPAAASEDTAASVGDSDPNSERDGGKPTDSTSPETPDQSRTADEGSRTTSSTPDESSSATGDDANAPPEPATPSADPATTDDRGDATDAASDPATNGTHPDAQAGVGREAIPDGIDCPDHVTLESLKSAVQSARTPYDVQRELDLDRGTTQQLLSALDLLDLVRSRMDAPDSDTPLETIEARIQSAVAD